MKKTLGPVSLTALEFDILRTLLARPGFVFTRELILDAAYAGNIHVADRTIDSHVRNIRAKMAVAGCETVIEAALQPGTAQCIVAPLWNQVPPTRARK